VTDHVGRGAAGTRPRARLLAAALAGAVALVGCTGDRDPQAELADAVAATAEDPFAFRVSARADRAALEQLGDDDAVAAAAFLDGAGIDGARDPDGRLRVAVTLGGDAPLLEVITGEGDALLLRTGLGAVLGIEDRDPSDELEPALEQLGVGPAGRDALLTSFTGGWVVLTDVDDLGQLLGAATDGGEREEDPTDLADLLDAVTATAARDAGEVRRLDVEVATGALLSPLGLGGGEDRTVPGTVDLRDGRVLEVRLELTGSDLASDPADATDPPDATDASDGADDPADGAGVVELIVRIDPITEGSAVERPEPGATLTAAELFDLVERLQGGVDRPGAAAP
jgi:hypothetical protein